MSYSIDSVLRDGADWRMEIVLKISENCNLACKYCYFYFRGNEAFKNNSALIAEPVVSDFVRFLERTSREANFSVIQIDLHGGEPLLYPKARFAALCREIRDAVPPEIQVIFNVQTNGTLIDDEWIDIFEAFNVVVGISLDGPALVNDQQRITKKGEGTHARAVRGLRLAQQAAAQGRLVQEPAILCVYNFSVPIEEIVNHFVNELQVAHFNLLLDDVTHDSFERSAGYQSDLYSKVKGLIANSGNVVVPSMMAAERQLSVRAFNPRLAEYESMKNIIITVSSEGDIAASDQVRICGDEYCYQGLNVKDAGLRDIIHSRPYSAQQQAFRDIPDDCSECCWRNVCRGGELVHRYSKDREFNNASVYCDILQDLYGSTAASLLKKGRSLASIEKSLGLSPEEAAQ